MKRFLALSLLAWPLLANVGVVADSTVYIEPMDGFGQYLIAAIIKLGVPLVPVTDRTAAVYCITGMAHAEKAGMIRTMISGMAFRTRKPQFN